MFEAKLITKLLPDYVEQNYIGEGKEKALETIALFKMALLHILPIILI